MCMFLTLIEIVSRHSTLVLQQQSLMKKYFTTENFTLLQKKLYYMKSIFLQNFSQLKFLLAFEKTIFFILILIYVLEY